MTLRCLPLGASLPTARLDRYLWPGSDWDAGVWLSADGTRSIVRSRVRPLAGGARGRERVRSVGLGAERRELDRSRFVLGPDEFVELTPDGQRLVLPATLRLDQPIQPEAAALHTVTLAYVGPLALLLGAARVETEGVLLRLDAGPGVAIAEQWLVRGVGEVSLGPVGGPPHRWLVGWSGAGERLFP